jgi:hypothetical protein
MTFLEKTMVPAGTIEARDLERLQITDSAVDAARTIHSAAITKFGLQWERKAKWILGEKSPQPERRASGASPGARSAGGGAPAP